MINRKEYFGIKINSFNDNRFKIFKFIGLVGKGADRQTYWEVRYHKKINFDDVKRSHIISSMKMPFGTPKHMLLVAKYIVMLKAKVNEKKIDKSVKVRPHVASSRYQRGSRVVLRPLEQAFEEGVVLIRRPRP